MKTSIVSTSLSSLLYLLSLCLFTVAASCAGNDDDDTGADSMQCTLTELDVKAWKLCGLSENDIYGIGENDVIHFNGTDWQAVPGGYADGHYYNIWCSSGSDIFLVGYTGSTPKSLIRHYDGQTWSDMEHPDGYEEIISIWGASPDSVFAIAVGSTGTNAVLHYNGTSWGEMYAGIGAYEKIWGTSATDVYAFRKDVDYTNRDRIVYYNGETWGEITPPVEGLVSIVDMWGTDADNLYFVGKADEAFNETGYPVIIHKVGSTWTPTFFELEYDELWEEPPNCGFYSVWGYGDDSIFAFGCRNQYFDGEQWHDLTDQLYQQELYGGGAIWGTDLKHNLVLAGYGRMLGMSCEQ